MTEWQTVNLRLDANLVKRIDKAAGPRNRTKFIVAACEAKLEPKRLDPRVDKMAVALEVREATQRAAIKRPHLAPRLQRASSLVTDESRSEWDRLMAERQQRLNKRQGPDEAA